MVKKHVTDDEIKENSIKLIREDSIRTAYMHTFKDSLWAERLAFKLKLDPKSIITFTEKSYGNWPELEKYLVKGVKINRQYVVKLLQQLSDKDFSDFSATILLDHLSSITPKKYSGGSDGLYAQYVLSPRIANEKLSPLRSFLARQFAGMGKELHKNVSVLLSWIVSHITVDDSANRLSGIPVSAEGVFRLRVSDSQSRDLFLSRYAVL